MIKKTPERMAPAFFDDQSEEFLSFFKTINSFKPLSVFARKDFLHLRPLHENELKENFRFLKKVEKCENKRSRLEHVLGDFHEISESLKAIKNGTATNVDLFEIKRFIHHHRMLNEIVKECLSGYFESLEDLWKKLDPQNSSSYAFAPFNDLISKLTKKCARLQYEISSLYRIQAEKIEKMYGIKIEDKKFVLMRRKAGELLSSNLVMVERESIRSYTFVLRPTDEIIELEKELLDCEDRLKEAEDEEVRRLSDFLSIHVERIEREIRKISELDLALAKIRGLKWGWSYPEFDSKMKLESAFHPIVKQRVERNGYKYTPLTAEFDEGLTMIFGPNMGGKTTALKTVGLVGALASYGFLVPAREAVVSRINWIRYVGTEKEEDGLSKFANQIYFMKKALSLGGKGLILIDEFGSGTNPYEGEALATSVAGFLSKRKNFSIMVTHYRETVETVECKKYTMGRINFEGEVTLENLCSKIDHHLIDGAKVDLGDAIKLAEIIGLPKEISKKAERLLHS